MDKLNPDKCTAPFAYTDHFFLMHGVNFVIL